MDQLLRNIQALVRAIPQVRSAPDFAPEKAPVGDIFSITYPEAGTAFFGTPGERKDLFSVVVEIMTPRKDLPRDIEKMTRLHQDFLDALMRDPTFGGTVETYNRIEWTFGPLAWNEAEALGYRFFIRDIKLRTDIL
jgi:hypothetical protein